MFNQLSQVKHTHTQKHKMKWNENKLIWNVHRKNEQTIILNQHRKKKQNFFPFYRKRKDSCKNQQSYEEIITISERNARQKVILVYSKRHFKTENNILLLFLHFSLLFFKVIIRFLTRFVARQEIDVFTFFSFIQDIYINVRNENVKSSCFRLYFHFLFHQLSF